MGRATGGGRLKGNWPRVASGAPEVPTHTTSMRVGPRLMLLATWVPLPVRGMGAGNLVACAWPGAGSLGACARPASAGYLVQATWVPVHCLVLLAAWAPVRGLAGVAGYGRPPGLGAPIAAA